MADILAALTGVIRVMAANGSEIEIPKRGQTLRGWALPVLAEAVESDEAEAKAFQLLESVRNLSKGKGKK